jgi:hypothetical protein
VTLNPAALPGFTIETAASDPVLDQAARELRLHLASIPASGAAGVLRISAARGPIDAFTVTVAPNEVQIAGANPRGALNGAYWLLEQAGFSWLAPAPEGTRFTPGHPIPLGLHEHAPAFARRTLILGSDALHDDWRNWLQFASRNRLNDIIRAMGYEPAREEPAPQHQAPGQTERLSILSMLSRGEIYLEEAKRRLRGS